MLEGCRRGDPTAFEEVVRRTYRQVYTQALRLVGDPQEAEDVAQEAYSRAFRGLPGFRGESSFETWLHRIVSNAAMTHLRTKRRFPDLASEDEDPRLDSPAPGGTEEATVDRDALVRALQTLPPAMRWIVVQKDVYELSCREIADELGISEGAVKVRLHRARRRLKAQLFGPEGDDEV